ncbi:MAG: hypothetical protein F4Z82_02820 [Caldilineaceae bacterium SB0668_bin_21]|nr:hypothetical protein [Caldilineaceae bacterium SB0668_bin_21]
MAPSTRTRQGETDAPVQLRLPPYPSAEDQYANRLTHQQRAGLIRQEMGRRARSFSPDSTAGLIPFLAQVVTDGRRLTIGAQRTCLYVVDLAGGRPPDGFNFPAIDDPAEALADDLCIDPRSVRNHLSELYGAELLESTPGRILWRRPRRVFKAMPKRGRFRVIYPTRILAESAGLLRLDEFPENWGADPFMENPVTSHGKSSDTFHRDPQGTTGVSVDSWSRRGSDRELVDASRGIAREAGSAGLDVVTIEQSARGDRPFPKLTPSGYRCD